jgi:peptide/nickel transport system permease protein
MIKKLLSNYIFRRIIQVIATIFLVATLTFFIIRLMPGNPVQIYILQNMTQYGMTYQEAKDQAAALFSIDLNAPLIEQWLVYLKNLVQGDFGKSFVSPGTNVSSMIKDFLPWTLFSVGVSILISFIIGIILGMIIAYRRGGWLDHTVSFFASMTSAIPNYLIGILILIALGVYLRIIPVSAMRGTAEPGVPVGFTFAYIKGIFFHAILPILTYVLSTIGGWILTMKNTTLSTLGEDYVMVAKARGLSETKIIFNYVGRNAILPLFTTLTMQVGLLMGGATLIETIFVYKGIGWALTSSIAQRDYPVMQAIFLIITFTVIIANFITDLVYAKLDPRIKVNVQE